MAWSFVCVVRSLVTYPSTYLGEVGVACSGFADRWEKEQVYNLSVMLQGDRKNWGTSNRSSKSP